MLHKPPVSGRSDYIATVYGLFHLPSSVSCHTMPSRLTLVPGSQGPRHSGSVDRATSDVFTATERVRTIICSHGEAISLLPTAARRWRGGGAGVETGDSICGKKSRGGVESGSDTQPRLEKHWINMYRADVLILPVDATASGSQLSTECMEDILVCRLFDYNKQTCTKTYKQLGRYGRHLSPFLR